MEINKRSLPNKRVALGIKCNTIRQFRACICKNQKYLSKFTFAAFKLHALIMYTSFEIPKKFQVLKLKGMELLINFREVNSITVPFLGNFSVTTSGFRSLNLVNKDKSCTELSFFMSFSRILARRRVTNSFLFAVNLKRISNTNGL